MYSVDTIGGWREPATCFTSSQAESMSSWLWDSLSGSGFRRTSSWSLRFGPPKSIRSHGHAPSLRWIMRNLSEWRYPAWLWAHCLSTKYTYRVDQKVQAIPANEMLGKNWQNGVISWYVFPFYWFHLISWNFIRFSVLLCSAIFAFPWTQSSWAPWDAEQWNTTRQTLTNYSLSLQVLTIRWSSCTVSVWFQSYSFTFVLKRHEEVKFM